MHARFSVLCTVYTPKNDSTHQFCSVVRTGYIFETIIYYDIIKLVVVCFITRTSFKTSSIAMLSNQSQYSSGVIEQWSWRVASLQPVQVAGKMFMCVLLDET